MYEKSPNKIGGLHHIAITTADMKAQIEFCTGYRRFKLRFQYRRC
jgi:hypothetical protein